MSEIIPSEWRALNATQRDVLVILAVDGPMLGADVNRALGRTYQDRGPTHANLGTLREEGYVRAEDARDEPGNAKNNYLTAAGRDLVADAVVAPAGKLVQAGRVFE